MDWKIILVLVISGAAAVGFVVLGVISSRRGRERDEALAEAERWKRKVEAVADERDRLLDRITLEAMSDEEALKELRDGLARFDVLGDGRVGAGCPDVREEGADMHSDGTG